MACETHLVRPLRTADTVFHRPSGEKWFLAYADYEAGTVCPMGWPFSQARIDDCEPDHLADDHAYLSTLAELAISGFQGAARAIQLAEIEIAGRS